MIVKSFSRRSLVKAAVGAAGLHPDVWRFHTGDKERLPAIEEAIFSASHASDILGVKELAVRFTVNSVPEKTLKALAAHTELGRIMATSGADCDNVLGRVCQGR